MKCLVMADLFEMTAETERHVANCAACQALVAEQKAILALLDVFEAPNVSVDFNRRLWQRIDAAPRPSFADAVRQWLRPAIPLAGGVALVVAGFLYDHRAVNTPR